MAVIADLKAWLHPPRPTTILVDVVAGVFVAAGVIGIIVYAAILNQPGANNMAFPHFFGLWLAVFMAFYGLEIAWQYRLSVPRPYIASQLAWYHYMVVNFVVGFIFLGSCVYQRADGAVWSLFLLPCTIMCTLLAWHRAIAARHLHSDGGDSNTSNSSSKTEDVEDGSGVSAAVLQRTRGLQPALAGINAFLLAVAFLFLVLVMVGTWTQAAGFVKYPPRGQFYTVRYNGGQTRVMAYCTGPVNATLPTFLFDIGGGGHSSSDLYGLQDALNALGRRVCTYDYPGCGHSYYAVGVQQPLLLDQIADALGEPGPFILVGTMDGGPDRVYEYALRYPNKTLAVIPISTGAQEFVSYQQYWNLTNSAAYTYARNTLRGRLGFGNIILAFGVQWGLMGAFVPPNPTYVPQSLEAEKEFLNLFSDKQWTIQVNLLASQVANIETVFQPTIWQSNRTLDAAIPVIDLWTYTNTSLLCPVSGSPLDSQECAFNIAQQEYSLAYNLAMVNITPSSQLFICYNCTGFLVDGNNLEWTVDAIMSSVGNLRITVPASEFP